MLDPSANDALACSNIGDAARLKALNQTWRHFLGQQMRLLRLWAVEKSAVFGHDPLEEILPRENREKIVKDAAGHKDHPPPGGQQLLKGGNCGVIHLAIAG